MNISFLVRAECRKVRFRNLKKQPCEFSVEFVKS